MEKVKNLHDAIQQLTLTNADEEIPLKDQNYECISRY